jgi:hypothetical protein
MPWDVRRAARERFKQRVNRNDDTSDTILPASEVPKERHEDAYDVASQQMNTKAFATPGSLEMPRR